MIYEKLWEFSDKQVLVTDTTAVSENIVDLTSDEWDEWKNMAVPLWIVVTCNVVPTGTSVTVSVMQHSTTSIGSGDTLMTGRTFVVADMSASTEDPGHYLFCVPWMSCVGSLQTADVDQYVGLVYTCVGNCTAGYVDAYLLATANPRIPTDQVLTSNI